MRFILKVAKNQRKNNTNKIISQFSVVQILKTRVVLPLISIFAGLPALGTLYSREAGIAKTVNGTRSVKH